jgi:hypothetical protein
LWDILWTLLNCHNFFLSLVSYVLELMGIQIDYMGSCLNGAKSYNFRGRSVCCSSGFCGIGSQREDFVTVLISLVLFLACGFSGKGNGRGK